MINQNLLAALSQHVQQQQQQQPRILTQFKAGCTSREGKLVKPDKRKGKVVICIEEQLLHFQWREREANVPTIDYILFPGEAKFFRVDKVKDGRVYCLEFQSSDRQLFFWLQEPKTDRDEEICKKVNECLSNTPHLDQYAQQQSNLMNFFQSSGPQQQRQQPRNAVQLDQLQQILQTMAPQPQNQQQQQQPAQQQSQQQAPQQQQQGPDLREILDTGALVAALRKHPEIAQKLAPHLPEGSDKSIEAVIDHVRSAPFQQTVALFDHALQSGELSGLMVSMGLPANTGSFLGGASQGLVNALQKQADDAKKNDSQNNDNKDKDDKMEM